MQPVRIGETVIETVVEMDYWPVEPTWLIPPATHEGIAKELSWMGPRLVEPGTNKLILSLHTYLIRTGRHTILLDTCCGNGKERGGAYPFHMLDTPYLDRLAALGVKPEEVDFVMCTHLHADHIGWNTHRLDGRWVPTFPNARYIISREEHAYWDTAVKQVTEIPMAVAAYLDSVVPVLDSGQVVLVADEDGSDLLGEQFRFFPLRGHTPGHTGLLFSDGNRQALLTGDAIHHAVQFPYPEWSSLGEVQAEAALASRLRIRDYCADADVLLLTGHFPAPTAGRVVSHGSSARFQFLE
ncbi:MAG TPA: MBL fold metallo-hydrolase [Terriglobales bacterium]|nr:MBL fold metallo-hydrolase [Terriglobales bacterium]